MGARTTQPGIKSGKIRWPDTGEAPRPVRGSGLGWVDWWDDASVSTAALRAEGERLRAERVALIERERQAFAGERAAS